MSTGPTAPLLAALALVACGGSTPTPTKEPSPAQKAKRVALQTVLNAPEARGDAEPSWGEANILAGGTVRTVALSAQEHLRVGAADFQPDVPSTRAVLLAHGHFGGGKSTPEVQQLAQRLLALGVRVLAVDTVGMEEWAQPSRFVHGPEAAHHRAYLLSQGSSALGLHLAGLQAGLDVLAADGVTEVVAAGASGGAAQAFWLAMLDDRVSAVALASPPALPRAPGTGGCSCDHVPGHPGPDPAALAALPVPSLWLSEAETPPLEGLGPLATWQSIPGEHGFPLAMQDAVLSWLSLEQGWNLPLPAPPAGAVLRLRTPGPGEDRAHRGLLELAAATREDWQPRPAETVRYRVQCKGRGTTALVVGLSAGDLALLPATEHRLCVVEVDTDPLDIDRAFVAGTPYADRVVSTLKHAAKEVGAIEVWAARGWSVAAAGTGEPCVLVEPPRRPQSLMADPETVWAHVPGLWSGGAARLWRRCETVGS